MIVDVNEHEYLTLFAKTLNASSNRKSKSFDLLSPDTSQRKAAGQSSAYTSTAGRNANCLNRSRYSRQKETIQFDDAPGGRRSTNTERSHC